MLVKDAVLRASKILEELENPRMQAELILCSVQNWELHKLYLEHSSELSTGKEKKYFRKIKQRQNRMPLQHILGETGFMGRMFMVGAGALIPRPETETLYEEFTNRLKSTPGLLLDVGTGTGIIAVSLGLDYPESTVIGTDISIEALQLAKQNIRKHNANNVYLMQADLSTAFKLKEKKFDGIIANLPYIRTADILNLEPEVKYGDPVIALDGGEDGLDLIRILLHSVSGLLQSKAILALELDSRQVSLVSKILEESGDWESVMEIKDLSDTPRIVIVVKKPSKINYMGNHKKKVYSD